MDNEIKQIEDVAVLKFQRELFSSTDDEGETYRVLACDVLQHPKEQQIQVNSFGNIVIAGDNLANVKEDVPFDAILSRSESKRYKDSYTVRIPVSKIPDTPSGQWKFLKRVVTESQYNTFAYFYEDDVKIIDLILDEESHENICKKVTGIKKKRLDSIVKNIKKREEYAQMYALFSDIGMSDNVIERIHNYYEDVEVVQNILEKNIYRFTEVNGVGFKTIDTIAINNNLVEKDSEQRIISALEFYLEENQNNGNTRLDSRKLIQGTQTLINVPTTLIRSVLEENTLDIKTDKLSEIGSILAETGSYKSEKRVVFYRNKYSAIKTFIHEFELSTEIIERSKITPDIEDVDMNSMVDEFEKQENFKFSDEQRQSFLDLNKSAVSFLAGFAGTGKSTAQKMMLYYAKKTGQSIVFLAPTGQARKKLQEYIQHETHTIHSYILRSDVEPSSIYFVDESSMVDVVLAKKLIAMVPRESKIVFAGDDAQNPSVSYGNFFYDCLNSPHTFVNRYTKVFRQEEGGILDIATKIREATPFAPNGFTGRRVFGKNLVLDTEIGRKDNDWTDKLLSSYQSVLETGKYSVEDIVVITPTKKGVNGTVNINNKIQEIVNPSGNGKTEFQSITNGYDVVYRVGDLVMNQSNDNHAIKCESDMSYEVIEEVGKVAIVNGDNGIIRAMKNNYVYVEFDVGLVKMNYNVMRNGKLLHSWCITAHKSQGSQYKVVLMLMPSTSRFQLNGNLMYVMVSRAVELALILGDTRTINSSLKKFENINRDTAMYDFMNSK